MLMLLSLVTVEVVAARNSNTVKFIELEKWDQGVRSAAPNPIECYLMDDYIEVRFIEYPELPFTLQIKDAYGNVVYQKLEMNSKQNAFIIKTDHLQPGSYELYYSAGEMILKGEVKIE